MQKVFAEFRDWFKDFLRALVFFLLLQTFVLQGFVIEGSCMEPELHSSEKIIVNKLIYSLREPKVGEVVVFSYPLNPDKDFVKRVVGIPGDTVEIKDGYLYRNSIKVRESYVEEYVFGSYGPIKIPENKLCVMGDNRNSSHDSRSWGLLDKKHIKGRAEIRFWPPKSASLIKNLI